MKISRNRSFWTKIGKVTAAQGPGKNQKFEFDPTGTSKDPTRGRDPKIGAKSAQERLTYTHSLFFGQKTVNPEKTTKSDHFSSFKILHSGPKMALKTSNIAI